MSPDQVLFKAAQIVAIVTGHGPSFSHRLNVARTMCNKAKFLFLHQLSGEQVAWPAAVDDTFMSINTDPKFRPGFKHIMRQTLAECVPLRDSLCAVIAASYEYEPDNTNGAMGFQRKGCIRPVSKLLTEAGVPPLTIVRTDQFFDYFAVPAIVRTVS